MACKNFNRQRAKCTYVSIYRKLRRYQSKASEENQERMKTANLRGKENGKEVQEALKGNQTLMNSATSKGKAGDEKEEEKAMSKWDCGSPLYDSYELVSLDHLIDRHLMAFPSSLHGSKPIITRFTHHSHNMMVSEVAQKVGYPEKSKGSFMVTSLSKFSVKIRNRKDNQERRKKNKEMRRRLAGFVVHLLCGGNRKHT